MPTFIGEIVFLMCAVLADNTVQCEPFHASQEVTTMERCEYLLDQNFMESNLSDEKRRTAQAWYCIKGRTWDAEQRRWMKEWDEEHAPND